MSTWTVIVPTNRPDRFIDFLDAWVDLFTKYDVYLIVIQDLPGHDEGIRDNFNRSGLEGELHHQGTIEAEHIPHRSDMIRSWGIYRAWKTTCDYVLSLDDDTAPDGDLFEAYEREFERKQPFSRYLSVGALTTFDGQMRGFPYEQRENGKAMVQYGGWNGILDYDAFTQIKGVREEETFFPLVLPVPVEIAVTTCIMNAAWRREFSREMWQLPLFARRYNRFGDIWSGLFQKKVLDFTGGVMLINGRASVTHERASNPHVNIRREKPGMAPNEKLWRMLRVGSYETVTRSAWEYFQLHDEPYANHFMAARNEWLGLFRDDPGSGLGEGRADTGMVLEERSPAPE